VETFFENLNKCVSRHTFTAGEMYLLDMTGKELSLFLQKLSVLRETRKWIV